MKEGDWRTVEERIKAVGEGENSQEERKRSDDLT